MFGGFTETPGDNSLPKINNVPKKTASLRDTVERDAMPKTNSSQYYQGLNNKSMSELKALSEEVDKIKAIRSINISKAQKK